MYSTLDGQIDQTLNQFSEDERSQIFLELSLPKEEWDDMIFQRENECAEECLGSFDSQL